MAQVKITDLTAYGDPKSTDVLAAVDVTADITKKVDIAAINKNAALGSATAAGMAFDGDPNTGLYSLGSDQIAVATGGTGRLFIDANGDITVPGNLTVTGALGVTAGTAAAPSLFISGSTNTGLYSPGAGQVAISTNGTGRLFVDASGNVLVGKTTSSGLTTGCELRPSGQVVFTRAGDPPILVRRLTNDGPVIEFFDDTLKQGAISIANGGLAFGVGPLGTERLRVTSAGLVGIGTSAPISLLHIQGTSGTYPTATLNHSVLGLEGEILRIGRTDATTRYHSITAQQSATAGGADNYLAFKIHNVVSTTAQTEVLRLTGNGRVGIGTTSPSSLLEISSSSDPQFVISNTSNSISAGDGIGTIDYRAGSSNTVVARMGATADSANEDGAHIVFENRTGGGAFSEKVRIDSSGRLLVGTSTGREAWFNSTTAANLIQIERSGVNSDASISMCANSNGANGAARVLLGKTRGSSVGATTVVTSGDLIGAVSFQGADGTELVEAASIEAVCRWHTWCQ
jgi:hypothetical protein